MAQVVVTGSFNVDHVWFTPSLPRPGETLSGRYATGPGGKGFNQAIAARRAGADTVFVCALGSDAGGALARALADGDGLVLRALDSDEPTGTAGILVDEEGRNSIVIGPGANAALDVAHVEAHRADITGARVLLVQLESPADTIAAAMTIAREAGVATVLNPAPANAPTTSALLAASDVITPNETEFVSLLARHVGERVVADDVSALDQASLHALCRHLLPHGTVVVTLGASGCFVSHAEELWRGDASAYYRTPAEQVRAIDTTGAGDAFNGSLASSLAQRPEAPFAQHIRFATRYAAASTESAGAAESMPHLAATAD